MLVFILSYDPSFLRMFNVDKLSSFFEEAISNEVWAPLLLECKVHVCDCFFILNFPVSLCLFLCSTFIDVSCLSCCFFSQYFTRQPLLVSSKA